MAETVAAAAAVTQAAQVAVEVVQKTAEHIKLAPLSSFEQTAL